MLTKRRVVAAKVETTEGVAETLTASDGGILAIEPKVDVDIKMNPRDPVMATLSKMADVPGAQLARMTFRAEMKGPGAAYSASVKPALGIYLRACGFAETLDVTPSAEKATYDPASSGVPSLTLGCYEDGVIKSIIGARGNVRIVCNAVGEPVYAEFDFLGVYNGVTDGALLEPTYENTDPQGLLNSAITIGSYSARINSFSIDMANVLKPREDVSKAAGYISTLITGRDVNGSFDPEMDLVANYDFYGLWKAGTSGALSIGDVGATQYNKFKITGLLAVKRKVADTDREGMAVADTAFQLAMNFGDDEIKIVFS